MLIGQLQARRERAAPIRFSRRMDRLPSREKERTGKEVNPRKGGSIAEPQCCGPLPRAASTWWRIGVP